MISPALPGDSYLIMLSVDHLGPFAIFKGALFSLIVVLCVLLAKAIRHRRNLKAVPIRIHVAGTRGKSTTVRLIAAALRAQGMRVLAKTTGTQPRLIAVDGSEIHWSRLGPATIREQSRLLDLAARERVDAIVVECMAIRPEMIRASEWYFVRATTTVITNARDDHQEDLEATGTTMGESLLHVVPQRGRLVISDEIAVKAFSALAFSAGTSIETVVTSSADPLDATRQLAAAVAIDHGVNPALLSQAFSNVRPDPGAFALHPMTIMGRNITFANAFSCNDVGSFKKLWLTRIEGQAAVILLNGRDDRPLRTIAFLNLFGELYPTPRIFVSGCCRQAIARARRSGLGKLPVTKLVTNDPLEVFTLLAAAGDGESTTIWGVGNYRGLGAKLTEYLELRNLC